jgi:hypothetical protein
MNTLLFHIGIPKTGSSAIQVFLARNRDALLLAGVDYLKIGEFSMGVAGRISSGNGAFLARCFLPAKAHAKIVNGEVHLAEALEAIKTSDAHTGLISSEMFVDTDHELMSGFLDMLRNQGIHPKVFYFIRAQDQFLMSSFVQQVKRHQFTGDPNAFALRAMKNIVHIRYDSYYRSMCKLFGPDNVVVRTFEGAQGTSDGLLHSILQVLSVNPTGLDFDTPDVNTAISGAELALMLALNKFKPRMRFSDMVVQNAQLGNASKSGMVHSLLNPEAISTIRAFFKDENRRLATSYFHRDELFPAMPEADVAPAAGVPRLDDLKVSELINVLGALLVRIDERVAHLERAASIQKGAGSSNIPVP